MAFGGFLGQIADDVFGIDDSGGIGGGIKGLLGDITGGNQERAAREGAALQEALGREGLGITEEELNTLNQLLGPRAGFGADVIPGFNQLFGGNVAESIAGSPTLGAFNQFASDTIGSNPFLAGLSPEALQRSQLISNVGLLSGERRGLLDAIGLGQQAAQQQGLGALTTGLHSADLLAQIGNVQAGGAIGAQRGRASGVENLTGALTGLLSVPGVQNKISGLFG